MKRIKQLKTAGQSTAIGILGMLTMAACGGKSTTTSEENEIHMIELESDSTTYGIYLNGGKDSIQWINEDGDTTWLTSSYARVFGVPEQGDRLAVVMNEGNGNEARSIIDITQLVGRWVEPDAVDEGMVQGIELFEGGAAASINSRSSQYVSWRLYNGKLLLVNSMEGMVDSDMPEDTFHLDELTKDLLTVTASYNKHYFRRSNGNDDIVREYDVYSSPEADAFNPEGEAPEGVSPDIPEEDKLY